MRVCAALLVAAFAAVAAGVIMAFAGGGLTVLAAGVALIAGLVAGGAAFAQMPHPLRATPPAHPVEWALFGVFAFVAFRAFFWLLYPRDNGLFILSPNNLGDISLHLDLIRYLASGVRFWPDSPILTGEPLKYPIGADFLNSLLLVAGVPVERGLLWVALAGSALTAAALWRWGRGFALAAFLFGGGLAGFSWLANAFSTGNFEPVDVQGAATWKNLFLTLFVTQRGLLLALPAGLLLLDSWRSRFLRGGPPLLPGWAALLLYATMPLHSVHTFLFLSAALLGIFVFARDHAARIAAVKFVAAAFAPAALCAFLVTGGFAAGGGVHWRPGWMQRDEKGVFPAWFWLRNFGLYLLLWIGLLGVAGRRRSRETLAFALPATAMFLACAFVSFAVWPWDNTKILLWCWLAVAPGIWTEILRPLRLPLRAAVCVVLFFTGAVSLVAGLDGRHGYRLIEEPVLQQTASAVQGIDPAARFACAPEYNHPLLLLGRKVALGYDGHLFSHGLDYLPKMEKLRTLMAAAPGWENAARDLDVDYLYWGPREIQRFKVQPDWAARLPVVARGDGFTIYRLPGAN